MQYRLYIDTIDSMCLQEGETFELGDLRGDTACELVVSEVPMEGGRGMIMT
jgi:hypothetical protein